MLLLSLLWAAADDGSVMSVLCAFLVLPADLAAWPLGSSLVVLFLVRLAVVLVDLCSLPLSVAPGRMEVSAGCSLPES